MLKLFAGELRYLAQNNTPTGIFKSAVQAPVMVATDGLVGDTQVDRRFHGGPEKALHQYAVCNYARLAGVFPEISDALVPGALGENLSVSGWDEANVCIGDVFQLGDALIQVSQPRTPCWKIDARFGVDGLTAFIAESGLAGWYFRVLEPGSAAPGGHFSLRERGANALSIESMLSALRSRRQDPEALEAIAAQPALSPGWVEKLRERAQKLRRGGRRAD